MVLLLQNTKAKLNIQEQQQRQVLAAGNVGLLRKQKIRRLELFLCTASLPSLVNFRAILSAPRKQPAGKPQGAWERDN